MLSSFAAFPLPIVSTESHSPTAIQHIFLFLFFSGYCRFFLFPPPPWPLLTATLFFVHCCCKRCNEIATKILDEQIHACLRKKDTYGSSPPVNYGGKAGGRLNQGPNPAISFVSSSFYHLLLTLFRPLDWPQVCTIIIN